MKTANLKDMVKGWFIGDFSPALMRTECVEAAVKYYNKGDYESAHCHKISREITVVAKGLVKMNKREYAAGDIILIEPGETTDFECMEDGTVTMVVKIPSLTNDKYEVCGKNEK
jgi:quercetin dioxygenase-like cupin family protein